MTVSGTNLSMVRGDSESITVTCSEPFATGDTVYMTVREDVESPIQFQKEVTSFTDGKAVILIIPEDTSSMEFGKYVYDIQVTRAGGVVTTLVKPSVFTLEPEVTY